MNFINSKKDIVRNNKMNEYNLTLQLSTEHIFLSDQSSRIQQPVQHDTGYGWNI